MTTIVLNDDIRNEAELNTAIEQAATYSSGILIIGFGANVDIKLNSALAAINLQSGVTLDVVGGNNAVTLDGEGQQRGLFVYSGVVNITNLTIENTVAKGGAGADEGGGGAGLGGGLFVAGATPPGGGGASGDPGQQVVPVVTLSNVIFKNDSAVGGNGGAGGNNGSGGGGGGLGGPGAAGSQGAGGPGFGVPSFGAGGAGTFGGTGGAGGFGGGGGGTISGVGSPGGFGGGDASGFDETFIPTGGTGGSSGGGGGEFIPLPSGGPGGFGAGAGGMQTRGGGGGGLGAGGDIFVQGGATLIIDGGSLVENGTVKGGSGSNGGGDGQALGDGIFIQGGTTAAPATITFGTDQTASQITSISGAIADQGGNGGAGALQIQGAGTVKLAAVNTYTGGTTIDSGVLEIAAGASAGSGAIAFGGTAILRLDATPVSGATYADALTNIADGDQLDLRGLAYAPGATAVFSGSTLTVSSGGTTEKFTLDDPGTGFFSVTSDGNGATPGTLVTGVTGAPTMSVATPPVSDLKPNLAVSVSAAPWNGQSFYYFPGGGPGGAPAEIDMVTNQDNPFKPFVGVTIDDRNFSATDTVTITALGATGTLSGAGLSGGSNGVYELTANALSISAALQALVFSPAEPPGPETYPIDFTLSDASSASATSPTASLKAFDIEDIAQSTYAIPSVKVTTTSEAAVHPFAGLSIDDPNAPQADTAYISVSGHGGTLTGPPALRFEGTSGGVENYILGGDLETAAQLATVLQSLVFTPDPGTAGTQSSTTLSISIAEAYGGPHASGPSSVSVTDIDPGNTACYCRGTFIRIGRGQKRVEELRIGDEVVTASGLARPIKWIGRRSYSGRFVMGRKDILPICFKAGSLDDNVPTRDLWISPHHAMYFENGSGGVLVEAKDLVNGVSVVQAERVDDVEYFHIELETHDVIIAEGALSETFVDDDNRAMFHNAHEYRVLYPGAATIVRYCAPRLDQGYEVEAIRQRVALRAGLESRNEASRASNLRGFLDRVTPHIIEGWAQNTDHPETPVCLDIYAGGRLIGQVLANRYRADLERTGLGSGRHSFSFTPPRGLALNAGTVAARRSLDGAILGVTAQARRFN
jgi:hypothetical protein